MTREEAIKIFKDKIKTMEHGAVCCNYGIDKDAFTLAIQVLQKPCDKCVYSTSEGCQYDDITETIPPFEPSDDAISCERGENNA